MSLKLDIEEMCQRAIDTDTPIKVKLPKPPLSWSKDQIEERFLQLYYLCQLNGCEIVKSSITDYKIAKLHSGSVILKPKKKKKSKR